MALFLVMCSFVLVVAAAGGVVVLEQWLRWIFLKRDRPPGPLPIPVLGNLLFLRASPSPHRSLAQLSRKYGPLFYLHLGIVPTVIVSTPEAAHQVLHAHDKSFASRPSFPSVSRFMYNNINNITFMCPYNDHWRWNRKFYSLHMFHSRSRHLQHIQARVFREEIHRAIMAHVYPASLAASQVNLSKLFFTMVQNIMYRLAVDKLPSDIFTTTANVNSLTREAERLIAATRIGEFLPVLSFLDRRLDGSIDRCRRALDDILEGVVTERERMKNDNNNKNKKKSLDSYAEAEPSACDDEDGEEGTETCMLDAILASDPPMERSKMKAMILEMAIGGSATTGTALEWAMAEVLNNERVMRKAVEEVERVMEGKDRMVNLEDVKERMPYIRAVVKETLRLHPSAPLLLPHLATQTCHLKLSADHDHEHGPTSETLHRISIGTRLMVNAWAIGRDPTSWGPTANDFSPERFLHVGIDLDVVDVHGRDIGLLPFGGGRRMCPGSAMAVSILELTIATFLHCFEWQIDERPLDMSEEFGLNLIRRSQLHALPTSFHLSSTPTCMCKKQIDRFPI